MIMQGLGGKLQELMNNLFVIESFIFFIAQNPYHDDHYYNNHANYVRDL